ncbi:hypothetical protein [Streptomyces pinistramenti]|uniref:hypothetical protein n=1 Tax=Streptomyces pinistramenti TaxID=2884812 RepID=UPI001D064323|nr:hypothetical protein [Streptomyces pinistramenti]MCB5908199.1 hypothetical protein [Streptomyces pinistramenti]
MTIEEAQREITTRVSQEALDAKPVMFQNLTRNLHKASQALEKSGALYAGCCVRAYDGELSLGTLLVTVTPFEFGDAAVAADGIVRSLTAARGESWAGSVLDTPNGPTAVLSGVNSFPIPAESSPSDEDLTLPMAETQAFLPVPQGPENGEQCLVSINFTTPCEDHWDEYCSDIVELLRSMTFDQSDLAIPESAQPAPESSPELASVKPAPITPHLDGKRPASPFG